MKLKDLTDTPTDYLDAYCEAELGHTNWAFIVKEPEHQSDIVSVVIFYKNPAKEEHEE